MPETENEVFEHLNKVSCGEIVHLQVITATKPIRLKTRLIGIDPSMSVILSYANDVSWEKASHYIKEGKPVVVRLMSNEQQARILAFRTSIQKIMSAAGRWLVLEYPTAMESAKLRKFLRIPVSIEAVILDKSVNEAVTVGELSDLSIQGCAFITAKAPDLLLNVGQEYRLSVNLEESGVTSEVVIPISVKNSVPNNGDLQYGLVFNDPDPQALEKSIQQLLLHHLQQ